MDENKIKVDTRISDNDYEKVLKIRDEKYDGNKSLALRMIIKKGIEFIDFRKYSDELLTGEK